LTEPDQGPDGDPAGLSPAAEHLVAPACRDEVPVTPVARRGRAVLVHLREAGAVAASLAGGAGLEAAEKVIRAGLIRLGAWMLEDLLAADPGYRGRALTAAAATRRSWSPAGARR
jgi:hypothetical protein